MNPTTHLFTYINSTMHKYWMEPAFSDYGTDHSYTYGEVGEAMTRLSIFYEELGIEPGDKIAISGSNCANWAVSFLSILAHGAVAVSILQDFTGEDIEKLVNHSDAKLLIAGPSVLKKIRPEHMGAVKAILNMSDFSLYHAGEKKTERQRMLNEESFVLRYPFGFDPEQVYYQDNNLDDLAVINYTSGTTSQPKGVMLTYRALSTNITYYHDGMPNHPGINMVSVLPLAHMYGMMFELFCQFCFGAHVVFMLRLSTTQLMQAYKEYHPHLIVLVPMVLEKIYDKRIKPMLDQSTIVRTLWDKPGVGYVLRQQVRRQMMKAFGGEVVSLIAGGAALAPEVEKFLLDIHFPFLVGYGMTETAPLVGYVPWMNFKARSCGKLVDRMEIRIDSPDEHNIPGEILLRGEACMIGYYKNEEATRAAFTEEGWMHTGDLGTIDEEGNIYLRGRCKTMILGPSGQNIYPEEIEAVLGRDPLVMESLIVDRDDKLTALIVPDAEQVRKTGETDLHTYYKVLIDKTNKHLPIYSQIRNFEIRDEEFEKTPKHSIKRFMYK